MSYGFNFRYGHGSEKTSGVPGGPVIVPLSFRSFYTHHDDFRYLTGQAGTSTLNDTALVQAPPSPMKAFTEGDTNLDNRGTYYAELDTSASTDGQVGVVDIHGAVERQYAVGGNFRISDFNLDTRGTGVRSQEIVVATPGSTNQTRFFIETYNNLVNADGALMLANVGWVNLKATPSSTSIASNPVVTVQTIAPYDEDHFNRDRFNALVQQGFLGTGLQANHAWPIWCGIPNDSLDDIQVFPNSGWTAEPRPNSRWEAVYTFDGNLGRVIDVTILPYTRPPQNDGDYGPGYGEGYD